MESHEGSLDLEMVRPDRNQGCTSSSPSSPSRADKVDLTSLSIFELEDGINRYRRHLKQFSMKDDNAKLRHLLLAYGDELARRRSCKETENLVMPVEAVERLRPEPESAKKRPEVFDLETEFSMSGRQLPKPSSKKVYPTIAVDCDKEDALPSPALSKEEEANEIQYLDSSPHIVDIKVCSGCRQAVKSQSNEVDGSFHCSSCKKNLVSPMANGLTTINSMRSGFTSPKGRSGSAKRSQQAIGDTIDTALELSDDEELKEVAVGESSSSVNLLKRKCMHNASEKLAGAKFLYPSR
ncbi:hypothetical protein GOP47_0007076 [Adiantum capillus-veneris]|uniref:Uncharacterized protein n=1 Tax=Adiantum capillus-veneris TaxID=13818 RepID=A0A9D4V0U1_ADICA|nr:hypothetical protein GOP47_0007076 [Adiantum capillus-veneris]